MPKKIINIDEEIGFDENEPIYTKQFRLFNREWTLVCDLNSFAISDLSTGEPAAIIRFLDSVILPEERVDFRNAMASQKNLTPERLSKILMTLVEAAAERPTTPPPVSSPGERKPRQPRKSVASSSVRRVEL